MTDEVADRNGDVRFASRVARAIAAHGVDHAYGLMGAGTIELTHCLVADHGVRYHSSRHESGAIGAADGFARASGRTGVCIVSWGPGLTNSLTALSTARRGSSPVVCVLADSSSARREERLFVAGTQGMDQERLLNAIDVPLIRVTPSSTAEDVALAFRTARERGTPVALLLPFEYLEAPARDAGVTVLEPRRPVLDDAAVDAAASVIEAAERILIIAGLGAVRAGAGPALEELADQTGALLATSLRGVGLFADHAYNLGICGGFSTPAAASLIAEADCVISFGASLNRYTTRKEQIFNGATVVRVDRDPSAFERGLPSHTAVCGDALEVAQELVKRLPTSATSGYRQRADAAGLSPSMLRHEFGDVSSTGALDPRSICLRLNALLPAERTVVTDCGQACEFPVEHMTVQNPTGLLWMFDYGAVGSGLGAAIGAAHAHPERTTVLFTGDGGLMMSLGDLDTAVRAQVPLIIVCLNDRAFGAEVHLLEGLGLPAELAKFETPDLASVARAIGCTGVRIEELDELGVVRDHLDGGETPLFLDCQITQQVVESKLRPHI